MTVLDPQVYEFNECTLEMLRLLENQRQNAWCAHTVHQRQMSKGFPRFLCPGRVRARRCIYHRSRCGEGSRARRSSIFCFPYYPGSLFDSGRAGHGCGPAPFPSRRAESHQEVRGQCPLCPAQPSTLAVCAFDRIYSDQLP